MKSVLRILMVEDSPTDVELTAMALRRAGHEVELERVDTFEEMERALATREWDVITCDCSMPRFSAPAALELLRTTGRDIPFIVVSGTVGEECAVDLMRAGAQDYVLKDRLARLAPAIERELRDRRARQAQQRAERAEAALESQLRQVQKLEAIGSLAGGVAHDFNNILSVILSYADLIKQDPDPEHTMRDDVEQIHAAAHRAAALTRQLLAFSRRQLLQPRVLDLNEVIYELRPMLRRLLSEDIHLAITPGPRLGYIHADPGQLEQVLMNLVVNARDAIAGTGTIVIETASVVLDATFAAEHAEVVPGPYVLLRVSDTGVGMTPEVRARIFEPFFTTKEQGKGTGLGLSTVFGVVRQSGGAIFVDSTPGEGATFRIYLPVTTAAPAPLEASQRLAVVLGGSETILLCEDEAAVRTLTKTILVRAGYHVIEAQHAGEALLLCEQHERIDLLVTDVVMPMMNGRQLAERLRRLRPQLKVLYMSGYTDDAIVRAGILRDQIDLLQKPVTPDQLARKVREVLDREG